MNNPILSGVKELVKDVRDFPFHKIYGEVAPLNIPNIDFDIADGNPIIIDQSSTDDCTGASTSEMNTVFSTDQVSVVDYLNSKNVNSSLLNRASLAVKYSIVPSIYLYSGTQNQNAQLLAALRYDNGDYMDFLYQFSKICQVMGVPSITGADIRSGMQSLVTYGSLPKNKSPFTFGTGMPTDRTSIQLSDWAAWPQSLDVVAAKYKIPSYFSVTGSYDAFDNIRSALWISKQNKLKAGVNFGTYIKGQWVYAQAGVIVDDGTPPTTGSIGSHDLWARGQKMIAGVPYLKVQNSWGKLRGDNGIYYFPRSVVNQMVALFGAFAPSSVPKTTAMNYLQNGIMLSDNWLTKFIKIILK